MDSRRKSGIRKSIAAGEKVHRAEGAILFLTECLRHKCPPPFTRYSADVIRATNWSPKEILVNRLKRTEIELTNSQNRLNILKSQYQIALDSFRKSTDSPEFSSDLSMIRKSIISRQTVSDKRRESKLASIISKSQPSFCPVSVHNQTDLEIPPQILDILTKGTDLATGGRPNPLKIATSMEQLLQNWYKFANANNIDPFTQDEVKSQLKVKFHQLRKCYSPNKNSKILTSFLDENPNLRILKVDKSKDLYLTTEDKYKFKLAAQFPRDKFEKLSHSPLNTDISSFRKLIKKLKPFLSKKTFKSIGPSYGLKAGYGIVKKHKIGEPLRIIVSSRNSISSGIEDYFSKIMKKMIPEISFSVDSTKSFKEKFLRDRNKFDPDFYKLISLDVVSMFPSIILHKVLPKICDHIYSNPTKYFETEILGNNDESLFPPREIFEEVFFKTLTYYTAFSTPYGWYRQSKGCAMGAKTSPLIANLMMHYLEHDVIRKEIQNKNIVMYARYVDDTIMCIRKTEISRIFRQFNLLEEGVKFTIDRESETKGINFLDTNLKYDSSTKQYEMSFFQKESKSDALQNFRLGVTPPNQKIGLLSTEIFRMNNTTSNENNLNDAIGKCKEKFLKNGYPLSLINNTVKNIKNSDFKPREKDESIKERHYLTLDYTSDRVNKIGKQISNIIRKVTPGFKVVLAFKSIRLTSILTSRLKRKIEDKDRSGLIYSFECECGSKYIGETLRTFHKRRLEHTRCSSTTAVSDHINRCDIFNAAFDLYRGTPNASEYLTRYSFARSKFRIVHNNLHHHYKRKLTESFMIKLFKPKLNEQVKFLKIDFI